MDIQIVNYSFNDENHITKFYLSANELEKWIHQNNAEYTGDFIEGCLLDNFVLVTKKGFAAIYEHYLTPWSSDYYIEYQKGAAQNVFKKWYDFEDRQDYLAKILG